MSATTLPAVTPFGWRKLHTDAVVEHRLDASGLLLLRMGTMEPPFMALQKMRNGKGGFAASPLPVHLYWQRVGDGWALRSRDLVRARSSLKHWTTLAVEHALPAGIDPRFVLTTMACESGGVGPSADGLVKKPRTERGYPGRSGENDFGDFDRDLEDWIRTKGLRSSHGLMQTLIATAHAARPDLFAGVSPREFRTVLWKPANSVACGVGAMKSMLKAWPVAVGDPLALRVVYGSGSLRRDTSTRWGVHLFDELIVIDFVSQWNEVVSLLPGSTTAPPSPASSSTKPPKAAWLALAFSSFALAAVSSVALAHHARRIA